MGTTVVMAEHALTGDEISQRKAWLVFSDDDVLRVKKLNELVHSVVDDILEGGIEQAEQLLGYSVVADGRRDHQQA